jgi:hypothetical protein
MYMSTASGEAPGGGHVPRRSWVIARVIALVVSGVASVVGPMTWPPLQLIGAVIAAYCLVSLLREWT